MLVIITYVISIQCNYLKYILVEIFKTIYVSIHVDRLSHKSDHYYFFCVGREKIPAPHKRKYRILQIVRGGKILQSRENRETFPAKLFRSREYHG